MRRRRIPNLSPLLASMARSAGMAWGGVLGGVAGVALGAMMGPFGIAFGTIVGIVMGATAGKAIEKDNRHREARTRQLDAMIGITNGSMGAGPISLTPSRPNDLPDSESWLAEWLTPPPPMATNSK